MYTITHTLSN